MPSVSTGGDVSQHETFHRKPKEILSGVFYFVRVSASLVSYRSVKSIVCVADVWGAKRTL